MKTPAMNESAIPDSEDASPLGLVRFRKHDRRMIESNALAWQIMGAEDSGTDIRDAVADNIGTLVPVSKRRSFDELIERAERDGCAEFDARIGRLDGRPVEVACWLSPDPAPDGQTEPETFRLAMVDVTKKRLEARERRRADRLGYLAAQYDVVFLVEAAERRARCLRFAGDELFSHMDGMRMALDDVGPYLAKRLAAPKERKTVEDFVSLTRQPFDGSERGYRRIEFDSPSGAGRRLRREAVAIGAEGGDSFLCFRPLEADRCDKSALLSPVDAMESEAIVVTVKAPDDRQRLVYANEAARGLFGDGIGRMADATPRRLFEMSLFPSEAAAVLERNGTAKARHARTGTPYRFRIDSMQGRSALRVLRAIPEPEAQRDQTARIGIRTFGYFDVFVDGAPIPFRSEKAKELLALLVDRRGGFVSSADAIAALWENEPISERSRTRYRKVALRLKNTLAAYGAEDILESVRGKRRILPSLVKCDLFDYLDGEPGSENLFRGSYLQNYSWAEVTLSELVHR